MSPVGRRSGRTPEVSKSQNSGPLAIACTLPARRRFPAPCLAGWPYLAGWPCLGSFDDRSVEEDDSRGVDLVGELGGESLGIEEAGGDDRGIDVTESLEGQSAEAAPH